MTGARRRAAMDLGDVRRHHLSLVLESLLRDGSQSRAQLAQHIGLTKATVSALVTDLLDRGLVEEREAQRSGQAGRPGIAVGATGGSVGALGLQIDVDRVAACVVDLHGDIRVAQHRPTDNRDVEPAAALALVREVGRSVRDRAERDGMWLAGGTLAIPGLVGPSPNEVLVAPNLGWHSVDLADHLARPGALFDSLDNEATLAAQGEARHGVARDLRTFVYVSGGVGVGGAIVLDGQLMRGTHGFAGELGHVMVDPKGPRCACGARGCLEVYVGAEHVGDPHPTTTRRTAKALAVALRSVVHLVDPEAVVLGGTLAADPEVAGLLQPLLNAETLAGRETPVDVRRSELGADAALVGAATRVLDRVIADPTLVPELVPETAATRSA